MGNVNDNLKDLCSFKSQKIHHHYNTVSYFQRILKITGEIVTCLFYQTQTNFLTAIARRYLIDQNIN